MTGHWCTLETKLDRPLSFMKPKEVKGLECPHCSEFIGPDDVDTKTVEQSIHTGYKCSECGEIYIDKDEATECCAEDNDDEC